MSENFPSMKFDFPYVWFEGEVDLYVGGYVLWHWHEEPEFCHVLKGEIEYHLADKVYILKEGDAMFINSNVLHMICPHNGCQGAVIIPQIFNKLFFIGYHQSIMDTKYYRPIINSRNLRCYYMNGLEEPSKKIVQRLNDCYLCAKEELPGYEIHVRNYISEIWLLLFNEVKDSLSSLESAQDKNNIRLKQMLGYIHEHYAERITLKEIADAASVSERECIRCLKNI
jgi:hypothetical protein